MSLSGRDSIPQEGALANSERRNTRVKRAVRLSSIVAQENLENKVDNDALSTQPTAQNGRLGRTTLHEDSPSHSSAFTLWTEVRKDQGEMRRCTQMLL
ncbi:hypothetical protein AAFF_G00292380 [Aldrovandia affinis]|uniref:Uncharacterized protein n=1 Tax=Aldrovandia affinis TaxID=143900 RepID=A0AAD7WRV4_9TELE|nr:hypothetical protein AAFF_G00292380 [Aldrovandia affinis]